MVALLAGCATVPETGDPAAESRSPDSPVPVAPAPSPTGPTDLTGEVMYEILLAEFAGQRGDLDTAVNTYLRLAHRLDSAEVAERATSIAVFAREDDKARDAAALWVRRAPDNLEARQVLAALYIRTGDADLALTQLRYVLAADPEARGQRLRMIAGFLGREQEQDAALEVMERLLEEHRDDPDALFAFAQMAVRAGNLDKARQGVEAALAADPGNLSMAVAYLSILQRQGETETALAWLEDLLYRQPEDFNLRLIYARLLADERRYEDARRQFQVLAEADAENTDVQYALGLLNLQANDLDAARVHFMNLVELGDRTDEASFYLGQIEQVRDNYDAAIDWFRAVSGGENFFDAQLHIALLMGRDSQVEEAMAHLRSLQPGSERQRFRVARTEGEILTEAGRLEEAMAIYDRALEGSYDTELLYTRAMLAEKMDRLDILERDLRQILEREPDNAQALNALGYTLADRTDRYDEAYDLISRALDLEPDDFYILDSMGWVLYRLGRLEEAVEYLRRAQSLRDDPEVAAHLGEVLWVMGERDEARRVWRDALANTPDDRHLLEVIERFSP